MDFFRFLPGDFLESIFWSKWFWTSCGKYEQVATRKLREPHLPLCTWSLVTLERLNVLVF